MVVVTVSSITFDFFSDEQMTFFDISLAVLLVFIRGFFSGRFDSFLLVIFVFFLVFCTTVVSDSFEILEHVVSL